MNLVITTMTMLRHKTAAPYKLIALILLAISGLLTPLHMGHAQGVVSVVGITPSAPDLASDLPPFPARLAAFAWQGAPGTDYTITFSVGAEPSLVVGVGAKVVSTSFDSAEQELTVDVTYSGAPILVDDKVLLADNTFLVVLDPGITPAGAAIAARRSKTSPAVQATAARPCYGPATSMPDSTVIDGDFGDEGGLLDPPPKSDADATVGLPSSAPGSFASTNTFYWCIEPASAGGVDVGFRVIGPTGKTDKASLTLSGALLDVLGANVGRDLVAFNLAIFSGGSQVSIDIQNESDGGISLDASLLFQSGATSIGDEPKLDPLTAPLIAGDDASEKPRKSPATAAALVQRSFQIGLREGVSLAPTTTKPAGTSFGLFGFIADPSLIGATVELIRLQNTKCSADQVGTSAGPAPTSGVVIARDVIKGNGSYGLKVPTSSAFPTNGAKANLVARIDGQETQLSRQISLSNQSRNARR